MARIDYKQIQDPFVPNQNLKLEPFNVALMIRVPGEVNPRGLPTTQPVKVRGMVDVAEKLKPAIELPLLDETGQEVRQRVRYYTEVRGSSDLVRNFDPNRVVLIMENADPKDKRPGLLLRLRAEQAAVTALREKLDKGESLPAGFVEMLRNELQSTRELLDRIETIEFEENDHAE